MGGGGVIERVSEVQIFYLTLRSRLRAGSIWAPGRRECLGVSSAYRNIPVCGPLRVVSLDRVCVCGGMA